MNILISFRSHFRPGFQPTCGVRIEFAVALGIVVFGIVSRGSDAAPIAIANVQRTDAVVFEKEILPILQRSCLACHSASERQGALILESPDGMRKGGDTGPAVVPGKGAESLLVKLASHQDEPAMPPLNNKVNAPALTPAELGLLKLWIDQGARGAGGVSTLSPQRWQAVAATYAPVFAVATTADGQYVAASRGNRLFLYHAPSGQLVAQLTDPALPPAPPPVFPTVLAATAPPAAGTAAAAGNAPPVPTVAIPPSGVAHRDLVESLAFNLEGDLLASGSFREIKIWKRPRDVQKFRLAVGGVVTAVAVSPNSEWIATASSNPAAAPNAHVIRLWKARTGLPGPTLSGHADAIQSLRFSSDSESLFSAGNDQTIRRWRVADGAPAGIVETPAVVNALELVEVQPPAAMPKLPPVVVTAGADNMIRTWSLPAAMPAKESVANQTQMVVSRNRQFAAVSDTAGNLRLLKMTPEGGWSPITEWKLDRGVPNAIDFVTSANPAEPPMVLTSAADGSISLWKLPEHALVRRWRGGIVPAGPVAASVDGKLLASGAENGGLTLWKNVVAEPVKVLGDSGRIAASAFAFHAQRRLLATAGIVGGKSTVLVQNVENGQITHTLVGHEAAIRSLAFSADGVRLVSGADDQTVRLWDLNNAQQPEQKKFMGQAAAIVAVAISPDQTQVLAAGADHKVRLWNVADGTSIRDFLGHAAKVIGVGYLAANQPYSVSADRTVRFWNPADGQQLRTFEIPSPPISMAHTPDGQRITVTCEDKLVRSFLLTSGQLVQTYTGHAAPAQSIGVSPDGKRLATLAPLPNAAEVIVWDLETGRMLEAVDEVASAYVFFDAPTDRVVLGDVAGRLWVRPLAFARHLDGNPQAITGLAFYANGQFLLAAARDGALRSYTCENGQPAFAANHGAPIHSLAVSTNEQVFVTGGENGTVRMWQPNGAPFGIQQIAGLPGIAKCVAITTDHSKLVVGMASDKPIVLVFDPLTGTPQQKFTGHAQALANVTILTDTGKVTSTSADATWQWSLHAIRQIPGHSGPVTALAAIPGSPQQVLSGSADTTIRRWTIENGQAIAQFAHGGPVTGLAVRPDGQRFASVSENHTIKLWNINGQPIAEMRGDVRRRTALARWTQQQTSATERLTLAKQQADAAEKDVPVKADVAQKAAAALAAATTDMQQKQTALAQATEQKIAAEKASILASTEARKLQLAKAMSETLVKQTEADLQVAQLRATQRASAASAAPNDAALKQAVAEAQQAVTATQQKLQQGQQAVQAATQASQTSANAANEMAQKVTVTQKPFNDALAALKTSEAAHRLATQQNILAAKELEQAQKRVPVVKDAVVKSEAALAEVKKQLEAATKSAADADQAVRSIAFSDDGRLLATAGEFTSAHTWDAETGAPLGAFAGHQGPLRGIAFVRGETAGSTAANGSTAASQLITGSADQAAIAWDLNPPWHLERTIGAADRPDLISHRVMAVDFSGDSTKLLAGGGVPSRNGELHVFNLADGARTVFLPQAHDDVVLAARFSPDGKRVASAGADKYMRTFDLASSQMLRRFEGHTNYVLGVAWKGDSQTLATSAADNTVKVWDAETGDQRVTIPNFGKHVTALRFIGESDNVVSSCGDRMLRMHVASNGGNFRNFTGASAWIHSVDITPNGELLVAGTADGSLLLWNGNTGQLLKTILVGK